MRFKKRRITDVIDNSHLRASIIERIGNQANPMAVTIHGHGSSVTLEDYELERLYTTYSQIKEDRCNGYARNHVGRTDQIEPHGLPGERDQT